MTEEKSTPIRRSDQRVKTIILVAILMLTQTMGWGTTISLIGVLAAPMGATLRLESGTIYAGITVMFLVGAAIAPASGRLVDRIGGLNALPLGSLLLATGLTVLSLAKDPLAYFAAWAIFGLGMHVALATAAYAAIVQVLGSHAHRGIGVLTLATGLCSTLFWPLSEALLQFIDWRALCGVYAAATLLIAFPAHLALTRIHGRVRNPAVAMPVEAADAHVPPELARRAFLLLATMVMLTSSVTTAMAILAIDLFMALGASRDAAVLAGSLIGVAYLVSRGIDTAIGNRVSRVTLARYVYAMLPLSLLPLLVCAVTEIQLPVWLAALTAVLYGLPAGLLGVLRPALPFHIFGSFGYGRRLGRLARPMDLANALAPSAFVWLMTLSPQYALWAAVSLSGFAFLSALALGALVKDGPNHRHYTGSSD